MNILVTGAAGFVGQALVKKLSEDGHAVTAVVRCHTGLFPASTKQIMFKDLGELSKPENQGEGKYSYKDNNEHFDKLELALQEAEVLIHTAARVHVMNERADNPLTEFRHLNTEATLSLALKAANAGVKRFIFLSTVKVNGESTDGRPPFSERDICQPQDPYGISKYEAEIGLRDISEETGMEVVIIRPPLIYGPGVKGNFVRMMNFVSKGVPLPLGAVRNQRSLLAMENLVDFLILCLNHPKAANETFLLSDGEDLSTTELIQKLAHAQGKNARLIPIPVKLMRFASVIIGKKDVADRLFGSLQINSDKARQLMNWKPAIDVDGQLRKMSGNIE
jgi:nucleoside-diphosphate-sugar epimerase